MANRLRRDDRTGGDGRAVATAIRRDRPLRRFLLRLAESVAAAGGSTFLTGGFPRDIADGKPGADIDVMVAGLSREELGKTLDALPQALLGIRKVVPAGRHFPMFRVATRWSRLHVDISAARGWSAPHGPDPAAEALSDAARRDFTINSLLYELIPKGTRLCGELLDPFGGIGDLLRRRIRCVGTPAERLREDPVRALRAIRMKNERKGYRIDPATWRQIRALGPSLLPGVPADRVAGELVRSLLADPAGTVEDLRRSGILRALLPELSRRKLGADRARRRFVSAIRTSPGPISPVLLLANLLLDLSPGDAETAARRLRFPHVRRVLSAAEEIRALTRPAAMRFPLARTEEILSRQEDPDGFLALCRAAAPRGTRPGTLARFFSRCKATPLLIDGVDLEGMGCPSGPVRRETLLAVRDETLAGKISSRKAALDAARECLRKGKTGKAGFSRPCLSCCVDQELTDVMPAGVPFSRTRSGKGSPRRGGGRRRGRVP